MPSTNKYPLSYISRLKRYTNAHIYISPEVYGTLLGIKNDHIFFVTDYGETKHWPISRIENTTPYIVLHDGCRFLSVGDTVIVRLYLNNDIEPTELEAKIVGFGSYKDQRPIKIELDYGDTTTKCAVANRDIVLVDAEVQNEKS